MTLKRRADDNTPRGLILDNNLCGRERPIDGDGFEKWEAEFVLRVFGMSFGEDGAHEWPGYVIHPEGVGC